jgi:L-ascorbate metabolism protein UlaG (beta-lactamase superfamily)
VAFPPTGDIEPSWFTPDFVSLTHDHSDHFHYPTLVVKLLLVAIRPSKPRWVRNA